MLTPSRLTIARKRRRLTIKALAEGAGLSPTTLGRMERGLVEPGPGTLAALAEVLGFPIAFFSGADIDELPREAASFRSLTAMTARERDAALAAGALAALFSDWVGERFELPATDLPALTHGVNPWSAARELRQYWGLGEKPLGSLLRLLEAKGVRVFSLAENTRNVDAFSCWRDGVPYVFLNTVKSAEHSRFDAAHELGHLLLHRHGGPAQDGRAVEVEANGFAAAFLMPEFDVVATIATVTALDRLVQAKRRWGVSVAALNYRLHQLGLLSDAQYRTFCIQINRRGYRTGEPNGLPREESIVWKTIFRELWAEGIVLDQVARSLHIPPAELDNLVRGLIGPPPGLPPAARKQGRPVLKLV
jgi:Zn-dependent peptidase ImmA (M78 family)/DNA-binding XRE family transcriptional regulator